MRIFKPGLIVPFLLLVLIALGSCKVNKVVNDKTVTTTTEETFVTKQKISIAVPERKFEVQERLPVFQPIRFIETKNGVTKIVHEYKFTRQSMDSTAILSGKIDSLGNLYIESVSLGYKYQAEVEVQNKLIKEQSKRVITLERQLSWFGKLGKRIGLGLLILLVVAGILLYIFVKLKKNILL